MLNTRPLQKKSWAEKVKNDYQWFKENGDSLIAGSVFGDSGTAGNRTSKIRTLYEIYNSKYPSSWFRHVTDPFSRGGQAQSWPAKIRPMNILRPNIEFLRGQYPKRPFNYQVVVKGEEGYSSFLEAKKKTIYKNLSQIFINTVNEEAAKLQEEGTEIDTGVDSKPVDMPDVIVSKFLASYKNTLAVQAQADIDLILEDQKVKEKLKDMIKDWMIAGEAYSHKDVLRDEVRYTRIDPTEIDYSKSGDIKLIQDGDWVVRRMRKKVSDIVDRFYDSLKSKDINKMEEGAYNSSPAHFHNFLQSHHEQSAGEINLYHYTWRSMEKIGFLSYPNPITGKMEEDIVDETYPVNKEMGETIEWIWRTRWMEGYRIGDGESAKHVEMGPVRFAPSLMNDLAKSQGPYNGKCFSNSHSENISILKLGLPFQIMYIIANFSLERTLAKSRGKIVLIDQHVIPKGPGWTDEKFFQFSEAQGWGLINRNQVGVDKSYNQYQVLDLGLFDHITNLIEIMDFCKRQYDEQLGIPPQAKAQVGPNETARGAQTAIFQSSIITEMVFAEFDELVRSDMEGLLDCSQISNVEGKRSAYVSGEGRTEILAINPEEYCYAQMGLMMTDSSKENDILNRMKDKTQEFAQNGATPSTIIEIETSNNVAKLRELLLNVERKQQEVEQAAAESEREGRLAEIELNQQFQEFNALLDTQKMHEEYNRKEDLVLIQGDINMALEAAAAGQETDPSIAGTEALMKFSNESAKIEAENNRKNKELASKVQAQRAKEKRENDLANHKKTIQDKEFKLKSEIKNKEVAIKKQQAKARPAKK